MSLFYLITIIAHFVCMTNAVDLKPCTIMYDGSKSDPKVYNIVEDIKLTPVSEAILDFTLAPSCAGDFTCKIFNSDGTDYTGSIKINTDKAAVKMAVTIVEKAYKQDIVVQCTSVSSYDTDISGPITVNVPVLAKLPPSTEIKKCKGQLKAKDFTPENQPKINSLEFKDSSDLVPISKSYEEYFEIIDQTCPVVFCQVLNEDCKTAVNSTRLMINPESPFQIQSQANTQLGFKMDVCYKCSNTDDSATQIIKGVEQITMCKFGMVRETYQQNYTIYTDTQKRNMKLVGQLEQTMGYKNQFPQQCPLECQMLNVTCQNDFGTGVFSIKEGEIYTNVNTPYNHTICLKCNNGAQTVQVDNINIILEDNSPLGFFLLWAIIIIFNIIICIKRCQQEEGKSAIELEHIADRQAAQIF